MKIILLILLFIIGSCIGSFLCCQVRRLHLQHKKRSKRLGPRSQCLHCHYQLKWYDNIPIISWLLLRGKCRKCHKNIGLAEILSELGTGLALLAIGAHFIFTANTTSTSIAISPLAWLSFICVALFLFSLIFLAIYDGLYGELPTLCLIISIAFAVLAISVQQIITAQTTGFTPKLITQPVLAALVLGGIYFVLYFISRGKWVGDGDWLLGTSIGLALGSPWLALIALFIANLFACLYALPSLKKTKTIHLGPFLVTSFVITFVFASFFQFMI